MARRRSLARRGRTAFRRLARRRGLAVAVVGALALVGCLLNTAVHGIELSRVHDEFSHLLVADTLAHGRLTNPTPAKCVHFESFHILVHPTYTSKYPPAQGAFLALGQVFFGTPVVGVWLSAALACAAITWMLQAWLPPRWALAGGLLAVVIVVFLGGFYTAYYPGYWARSYFGGAVAALGGALVFGAWRRLWCMPSAANSTWLGVGLALLANTRPFEGLVVTLPPLVLLAWQILCRGGPSWRVVLGRVVLPAAGVLIPVFVWMGYYNWRVTGDPLKLPYTVYEENYATAPLFVFGFPRPEPTCPHEVIRDFQRWALASYHLYDSLGGWLGGSLHKLRTVWTFYIGLPLTLPWLALLARRPDRWTAYALACCGTLLVGLFFAVWTLPHYTAPIAGLMVFLDIQAIRTLRALRVGGRFLLRPYADLLPAAYLLFVALALVPVHDQPEPWWAHRARIIADLEALPGKHLVLVRYRPGHPPPDEWVYNGADIEGATAVWARSMNPFMDQQLTEAFADRQAWYLDADALPPQLSKYRGLQKGSR